MSPHQPGCSFEERSNFLTFLKKGWIDVFRQLHPEEVKYTWWNNKILARQKNIGWRIDYFIINKEIENAIVSSEIKDEILGSDHCPIEGVFDFSKLTQRQEESKEQEKLKLDKDDINIIIENR